MAAELRSTLSVNNKPFIQGMNEAVAKGKSSGSAIAGSFTKLGPQLAAAFSIGAVVNFGKSIINLGGELADTAERLSLNVETLQGLQFAFGQSGANAEAFEKGMVKLNQSMADAENDTGTARAAFEQLGITFADIEGKSPEQVLYLIADAMKKAENPTLALSAAMDLLGKGGAKMIPTLKQGSEAIKELAAEALKLTNKEKENIDEVGDAFAKMWQGVRVIGGKVISAQIDGIHALAEAAKEANRVGVGDIFGKGTADARTPNQRGEYPTADTSFKIPERPSSMGGSSARGRKLTGPESEKLDEEAAAEKAAGEAEIKRIEDQRKAMADFDANTLKNKQKIAALIREATMEGLTGEQKLTLLTAERLRIMQEAARFGAYTEEQKLAYVEKSVEIARQIRENQKENKAAAAMQAAAAGGSAGGLRTGGLRTGGLSTGGLGNAHGLIRRGDAARAKAEAAEAKKGNDPLLSTAKATARNTANLAKAFGVGGVESL